MLVWLPFRPYSFCPLTVRCSLHGHVITYVGSSLCWCCLGVLVVYPLFCGSKRWEQKHPLPPHTQRLCGNGGSVRGSICTYWLLHTLQMTYDHPPLFSTESSLDISVLRRRGNSRKVFDSRCPCRHTSFYYSLCTSVWTHILLLNLCRLECCKNWADLLP